MMDLFRDRFLVDPLWATAAVLLVVFLAVLILMLWWKNRSLSWYFGAGLLAAGVYALLLELLPFYGEQTASLRSDWALLYLVQHPGLASAMLQVIWYSILFALLGVTVQTSIVLWCFITLRWKRMRVLIERSISFSWLVLWHSILLMGGTVLIASFGWPMEQAFVELLLMVMSGLFLIQFVLRFVDAAHFSQPTLMLQYAYVLGLFMLGVFWVDIFAEVLAQDTPQWAMAVGQLMSSLLLMIVSVGILSSFVLRSRFASPFFVERQAVEKGRRLDMRFSTMVFSHQEQGYTGLQLLYGSFLAWLVVLLLLVLVYQQLYLLFVPVLFAGFFVLFICLDAQEDLRIRGDLVEWRIQQVVRGSR